MENKVDRLDAFEDVMNRYYRGDPLEAAKSSWNRSADQYNQWVKDTDAAHQTTRVELEKQFQSLGLLEKQIRDLDQRLTAKPDMQDAAAIEAYNALASERNQLVGQYNELGESYKRSEKSYNETVSRFQQQMEDRQARLDAQKRKLEENVAAHQRWLEGSQDLLFFRNLNQCYAELLEESRSAGSPELTERIDKLRAIRRELADRAVRRHEKAPSGLIVVRATLCRREPCLLVVDTGATVVAISPTLVEVLELSDQLGEEIEVTLAGGIRLKARKVIIPQVSVLGREARDVKAVVLDESEVGVDGLLGLSFLNRFAYQIDEEHPDKLILKPRSNE